MTSGFILPRSRGDSWTDLKDMSIFNKTPGGVLWYDLLQNVYT